MFRSMYTAASGMTAQQMNLDNIANNLANSSTAGYSSSQVDRRKVGKLAVAIQVAFQELGVFPASSTAVSVDAKEPVPFNTVQALENAERIDWVCDATIWILTVNTGDIILRDGTPVHIAVGSSLPSLNSREQSFGTWTVALDGICLSIHSCVRP